MRWEETDLRDLKKVRWKGLDRNSLKSQGALIPCCVLCVTK